MKISSLIHSFQSLVSASLFAGDGSRVKNASRLTVSRGLMMCLVMLLALVPFSGAVQAEQVNYTLLINQENADDDTFLVRNELTETLSAAMGTPLTDVLKTAELGSKFSGFHLTGTGAEITGYQPDDDITQPAGTYSEKSSPAFLFAHYNADGSLKMDAMGTVIDGRVVSGFYNEGEFISINAPSVQADGSSVVLAFYSRDRYAISLRTHNDADPANPVLSTGDAQIPALPESPLIIKQGSNLYERLVEDEGVGEILKYFSAHEPSYGDELQWTWWARWKGTKENGDPVYEIDPGNQFVGGRSRNMPLDPKHTGTVDRMEGPAYGLKDGDASVLEMWKRSVKLYGINYTYYEDGQVREMFDENGVLNPNVKEEVVFGYHNDEAFYKEVRTNYNEGGYTVIPVETEDINTGETKTSKAVDSKENELAIYADKNESETNNIIYNIGSFPADMVSNSGSIKITNKWHSSESEPSQKCYIYLELHKYSDPEYKNEEFGRDSFRYYPYYMGSQLTYRESYTISNVSKYCPTQANQTNLCYYQLIVSEETNDNYKFSHEFSGMINGQNSVINLTNTQLVDFEIVKNWEGDENSVENRPESVTISLLRKKAGDEEFQETGQTLELSEGNSWYDWFKNLPVKDSSDGISYEYDVTESSLPEGYVMNYFIPELQGSQIYFTITNTYTKPYTKPQVNITVKKNWDDEENKDELRPDAIIVELLADGTSFNPEKMIELNEQNGWTGEFGALDKYNADDTEIKYTVKEHDFPYIAEYEISELISNHYSGSIFTITNTHVPENIKVAVTKNWDDDDNRDGIRPDIVYVLLYDNEEQTGIPVGIAPVTESNQGEELEPWTVVFSDLPKYATDASGVIFKIPYTADELYVPTMTDYKKTEIVEITGPESPYARHWQITNKYEPEKVTIKVTKDWDDADNQDGIRPSEVIATLYKGEGSSKTKVLDSNGDPVTVVLNAANGWSAKFPEQFAKENGVTVVYSVDEEQFVCPRVGADCLGTDDTVADSGYQKVSVLQTEVNGWTITNKHNPEKITVRGTKEWVGAPDDYVYPENITIELRDGNNNPLDHTVGVKADDYAWSFTGLDKYKGGRLINYAVAEFTVPGFTKRVDAVEPASENYTELVFKVMNTYNPEKTQLRVSKIWQDEENRDGIRPGSVTVMLKSDGGTGAAPDYVLDENGDVISVVLNSSNSWSTYFTDLPIHNADGQEITYSVEEDNFSCPRVGANCLGTGESAANTGYQMVSTIPTDAGGYAITNKHIPETIEIPVAKSWADDDDRDGIRPRNVGIVIRRTNDGAVAGAVTLTETQPSHTFTDLYKYCSGELCKYTVDEPQEPEGYTMSNAGCVDMTGGSCTITNTHTPETVEIGVKKNWDDANDQDGIRPTGDITVTLYKGSGSAKTKVTDSTGADVTVILNPENNWTAKFPVQPAKENKQTIVYSVEESDFICKRINDYCLTGNPDTGYQQTGNTGSAASGFTITNKHNPEKITVKGTKEWIGVPEGYELPESITLELKANNTAVEHTVGLKTNSPAYSWSFPNVDKYANGHEITYTVAEYTVPGFTKNVPTSGTLSPDGKELSFVVTNTYDPENTQIRVNKIWTDDENRDGLRPDEITVTLYSDGGTGAAPTAVKSMKLSEDNNWSDYFRDLPIHNAAGQEISYTVDEEQFSCNELQNCLGTDPKIGYVQSGPVVTEAGGYAITDTHTPATIDIPVTKVWADDNDRDGIRPNSVTFIVRRTNDNKVVDDVTLSGTQTTHTFTGLYKYCGEGELCEYTVTEPQVPQGYTMINNQTGVSCVRMTGGSCTITNKHDPETIKISVTKVWDDMNNTDNSRPEEVVVEVLADGVSLDPKVTITLNDDTTTAWTGTSSALPKYRDGGTAIVYTLAEYTVENYETSVPAASEHPEDGYTITNTYTLQPQPLVIRKTWVYNDAPESAKFSLRQYLSRITVLIDGNKYYFADVQASGSGYSAVVNGTPVTITATGTDSANWTITVNGLPKNRWDAGKEEPVAVNYSIEEDPISNFYTEYGEPFDAENGFPITNKYNVTEVTVTKRWVDDNDSRGDRPESVLVHLHGTQDGSLREQSISAADAVSGDSNTWSYTFTNLPKYDSNGEEITYYSHEINVDHYLSSVSADGLNITNTWTDVRQININVNKYWDDDDNRDGKRPDSVTFNLLADGVKQDSMTVTGPAWTGVFGPLSYADETGTPINYTVTEETVVDKDGKNSYTPKAGDPAGSIMSGLIFTNSRDYETVKIRMTKNWDDFSNMYDLRGDQPLKLLQRFKLIFGTVQYSLDNLTMTQEGNVSTPYIFTASVQGYPVTITASGVSDTSNSWTIEIDGLPKYKNGSVIDYDITENPDTYAFTRTKETTTEENTFVFTGENFLNMQQGILTKVWEDENDKDSKRPTDPMQMLEGIRLYANGEYYHHGAFTLNSHEDGSKVWTYTIAAHPNVLVTVEDNNDNTWTVTVDKLPRLLNGETVVWTVSEDMDGYDSFVDGLTVTNIPQVSVDVKKVWNDGNNQDGIRPTAVIVSLFKGSGSSRTQVRDKDGRNVTLTLSEGNNWSGSFTGLPKYETVSGAPNLSDPIMYSVEEPAPGTDGPGTYAVAYSGSMADGYTITNTHTPELVNITVNKIWDDENNRDGRRAAATVQLYANGMAVSGQTLTIPVTDEWSDSFRNLPKYRNGVEINYEVRETPPAGYTPSIAEGNGLEKSFEITNTYTAETVSVPVRKVWDDDSNRDGLRSKLTATVQLYANGTAVDGKTLTVGTADGWRDAFSELPKYENGTLITYTVQETIVYDSSVTGTPYTTVVSGNMTDGFTITNKHVPSVRDVTITKVWDDENNQDGLRRDNLTFNLYQNGNLYRTVTSDSIVSPWTYTWKDLPENCGGTACIYNVDEPTVPRPYTKSVNQETLTVTNSYTPETVNVTGKKTWADNDDRAGMRPDEITITLMANGEKYEADGVTNPKTVTAGTKEDGTNAWSWSWAGLPKYAGGNEITWSVSETTVPGYTTAYPSGYNVTNTYNEGFTSITVQKVWKDDSNRDGIRPSYVNVYLVENGTKTSQYKALADANGWKNTFTDLPIYKDGAKVVYTIEEVAVNGYDCVISALDENTNTYTVTNTHEPATTTIQGSKTWINRELDPNPSLTAEIEIMLYADGSLYTADGVSNPKTITESTQEIEGTAWSWKWEDLPVYRAGEVGQKVVYTIRETPITGYNTTYDFPNVTNTYSPGKTSLTVRKAWVDGENRDGIRPGHVEVSLLSKVGNTHFTETGQTAILVPSADNPDFWRSYTFTDLDRYTSAGVPITYSVKETAEIEGYESITEIDPNTGVYVITNTHEPETIDISGRKVWNTGDDDNPPTSAVIQLLANGLPVSGRSKTVTAETKEVGDTAWTWKWEGLPKYANGQEIRYTVSESHIENYTYEPSWTAVDGGYALVVTNTYNPGTITIRVQKVWNDNNDQDGIRPESVEVNLIADNSDRPVASKTLPEGNVWRTYFEVPEYTNEGEKINYTVTETFTSVLTRDTDGHGTYALEDISGDIENGFVIANVHTPEKITISGTKTWVGDEDAPEGTRPDHITLELLSEGSRLATTVGEKANDYAWSFTNLDKYANGREISYVVSEFDVTGYERDVQRTSKTDTAMTYEVTNTYSPDLITLRVTKRWDDNNNQDGYRPESLTVNLYKVEGSAKTQVLDGNDQPVTLTLTETDRWTGTFRHLPKYEEGREIVYTIDEAEFVNDDKYSGTITGDMTQGYIITNTHDPETVFIHGSKIWSGDEDAPAGTRPDYVTFELLANGVSKTAAVAKAPDYEWSFPLQPRFSNGSEIVYTVTEYAVSGYDTMSQELILDNEQVYDFLNVYNPGKTSVKITKEWNDLDDQDGMRPPMVTVQLVADGTPVEDRYLVLQAPSWSGTFNNLDVSEYGKTTKIVYTVREVGSVSGYTSSEPTGSMTEGYTITNTHTPETVTVSGSKTWNDNNNQDGKRPDSITIRLMKDNVEYDHKTVSARDEWKWSWTGLPKYEKGSLISWTINEDDIPDYTKSVSGYNVTNSYTPGKTAIRVNKVWDDEDDQDGLRQINVTVFLKANGETISTGVLNEASNWSYLFSDLDRSKDGQPITYTVEELHTAFITGTDGPGTYEDEVSGDAVTGFTITNTHTPETVTLSGTKTWVGTELDPNAPTELKVHLFANGTEVTAQAKTVTAADGWKWEWKNLPKYANGKEITYTMSEDTDYTKKVEKVGNTFNVTNTYNPDEITVLVRKVWNDNNNQDGIRPPWTLVNLKGNGEVVASEFLNESNNWRVRIDVPEYDENRQKIEYSVEEVFTRTVTKDTDGPGTYILESITGNAEDGFTITNKHTPETVSVSGAKTWDDDNNAAGKRPGSITIRLVKNGINYGTPLIVSEADGWKWEWKNLPKYENGGSLITWTIFEDTVEGYSKDVSGYDVTNSYTPDETVVTVSKAWFDQNNQDGIRPDHVRVYLYANGVKTEEEGILIAANDWVYRFRGLPVYKDGKKIIYTVKEDPVPTGYTVSYSGDADTGLIVTNTHEPEKVKVVVTKTWDDAGNENNRPETVNLYLQSDGTTIRHGQFTSAETAAAGWKWEVDNLPKYKGNGTAIVYTIVENAYGEYSRSVERTVTPKTASEKEQLSLAVTNKWTPGKTSIMVEKEWTDENNQDGIRPPWVLVNLLDGDGNVVASDRLSESNNWIVRFEVYEFDESGSPINYTVEEVYDQTVTETTDGPGTYRLIGIHEIAGGFEIENGHTPETVSVKGTKTWHDAGNESARPESITIRLLADGAETEAKEVTEADGWSWEFSGLPKYKAGKLITYTITEDAVPNYRPTINGHNVTNTYAAGETSVNVKKVWTDGDNQDGLRDWVVIKLLANGKETDSMAILSDANHWEYTFTGIPETENGKPIVYSVEEEKDAHITGVDGPGTYKIQSSGDQYHGFTVTNIHTPETLTISGQKTWDDNNDRAGERPESILITLYADNEQLQRVEVTENDDWAWTFENLPKYANGREIRYSISEEAVKNYTPSQSGYDITNTYTPGKTSVKVTKVWNDDQNRDNLRPSWILVKLLEDGVWNNVAAILTEQNQWSHTFTDLDKVRSGNEVVYTVEEQLGGALSDTDTDTTYGFKITGNAESGYVITNTHTPQKTSVKVTKKWENGGMLPAAVTIHLFANGIEIDSVDLRADENGNWEHTFSNLPKMDKGNEIAYTITEDAIEDFTSETSGDAAGGYLVTNTYSPGETSLTVRKVWEDKDDQDGKRPSSVTVDLLADGKKVDSAELNERGNWQHEFTNIPVKDEEGKTIEYTVSEVTVDDYTSVIEGSLEAGYTITNTHRPEKTSVKVTKKWLNDSESVRPSSIMVRLMVDNVTVDSKEITAEDGWEWTFSDLDKYKAGKLINYVISEDEVDEYSTHIDEKTHTITNTFTPGKVSVSVHKVWDDADNQDGKRPDAVTVKLLRNGQETGQTLTLDGNNEWTGEFTELEKYDENYSLYKYSVAEDVLTGAAAEEYVTVVTGDAKKGYLITNMHTPEETSISITKEWDDDDDRDGKRPASIHVQLKADGETIRERNITADDNWTWVIDRLPVYKAGQKIVYTVTETQIEDYSGTVDQETHQIVNKHDPGKTMISVSKSWNDGQNQDGIRPSVVTVKLLANGVEIGKTVDLNEGNSWYGEFTDLFVYNAGVPIVYTIEEVPFDRLTGDPETGYSSVISGSASDGFTISNTHTPEVVSISGSKTWDDFDNEYESRPESITVRLMAGSDEVRAAVVTEADGWRWNFTDMPRYKAGEEINYTVREDAMDGYTPEYDGYSITNRYTPAKTSVSVLKVWNDRNDADELRPATVTVHLLANGEIADSVDLSETNGWSHVFTELDTIDEARKRITYSVEEVKTDVITDEDGLLTYKSVISGDVVKGYTITNTHTVEVLNITVKKLWMGEGKAFPVTIKLLADGNDTGKTLELSGENSYSGTFEDLPKIDKRTRTVIRYSISEENVPDNVISLLTGSPAAGYKIINIFTDEPEDPDIKPTPEFFNLIDRELPETGITTVEGFPRSQKPASVNYKPVSMELMIPTLNLFSDIVMVAPENGRYPVEWLQMESGLLEGTALPGEGLSVIAGHNTLNADDYGPFALISEMEIGDRFFIQTETGELQIFEVYANDKIDAYGIQELYQNASAFENTVTLLTCEDEREEGGYASRRIVSARMVN